MAGWLGVVLLGRVLLVVVLKASLAASGCPHPLMDFAVVAMTISVALEIAAYGLVAAAAQLGAEHAEGMIAAEWSAGMLLRVVNGPIGLALLASVWSMWRSGLFPKVLNILGTVAAVGITLSAMFIAPAYDDVRTVLEVTVYMFFIWMLWTAVLLAIRTPKRAAAAPRSGAETA